MAAVMEKAIKEKAKVVDTDTHFWQPVRLWEHFLSPAHREGVLNFLAASDARKKGNEAVKNMTEDASGKKYSETGDKLTERLEHMDREGVDVQIIFPGAGRAPMIPDPELSAAACRAVNQWNAQFAAADPKRFKPVMVLPMRYPDAALAELRYAAHTLGLESAFVAPTPAPERRWSDAALDPLWREMEASRIVVCMHEFTQLAEGFPSVSRATYRDSYTMMYHCGHTVEMQLALMDLIVGGVMERFPTLQFGFIEAHTAWLPGWLAHMDSLGGWLAGHKRGKKGVRNMSLLPTEFFRRQCFLASFPDDAWIEEAVKYIGEDNVVICTDYPHPGTSHQMVKAFDEAYPDFSPAVRAKLLGANAARIFRL